MDRAARFAQKGRARRTSIEGNVESLPRANLIIGGGGVED